MGKGCFINCVSMPNEKVVSSSGVMKKVYSQIKILRSEFEVDHILINTFGIKQNLLEKIKRRLPFFPVDYHWKYSPKFAGYDFIYFRKSDIDYTVYRFLSDLKKYNSKCKIIFEIPTYPYEKENFHGKKDYPMLLKDRMNHKKLYKCVDRIVTFSSDNKIWGIPTIKTKNGIDFSEIPVLNRSDNEKNISLIEVSSPAYWHGYDRLLEGMGIYYSNGGMRDIVFHIVGDGKEIEKYREIVQRYNIDEHVVFHGNKYGRDLDLIYQKSFIGIDSLGRHRSNNFTNSSLKSREYAAYGIPFVAAVPIDFAENNWEYVLNVPLDDSPIDIEKVIEFYDSIYAEKNCDMVSKTIRGYAEDKCDISVTMRPIIEYLQQNEDIEGN